jgi:hypothetical protein
VCAVFVVVVVVSAARVRPALAGRVVSPTAVSLALSFLHQRLILEHEGRSSARRGPYRIIYEIDEDDHLVRAIAIGHRRDVYHRR